MHMHYSPEHGFTFFETVLTVPELKPFMAGWGETALHYMAMFSHPNSLHVALDDYEARDEAVLSEMRVRKLGKPEGASKTRLTYPLRLFKEENYNEAAAALLRLKSIPELEHLQFLKREQSVNQKAMSMLVLDPANPDKMQNQIKAKTSLQKLINDNAAEIDAVSIRISKRINRGGIVSLDELWNEI